MCQSRFRPMTVLLGFLAVILAAPAGAQVMMKMGGDFGGGMMMINQRGVTAYGDLLGLDEDQREFVHTIFEGYMASYQDATKRMKGAMEDIEVRAKEDRDFTLYSKEMPRIMREYAERAKSLEETFFQDMRLLLTSDQEDRWVRVERKRRRETGLHFGMISGSAVDIISVVESLSDTRSSGVDDALMNYEVEMDRVLTEQQRNSARYEDMMEDDDAFDFSDPEKMSEMMEMSRKVMKDQREYGIRLRDLNQRHARVIQDLLPEDHRGEFERAFRAKAFPRVYRTSHATRMLDAADGFADLSSEQRETLRSIRSSYARELEAANQRWASAIREDENEENTDDPFGMARFFGGKDDDTPVGQARAARKDLDKRIEEKINGVLNNDQQARLPEREYDKEGHFGGADGFHVEQHVIIEGG